MAGPLKPFLQCSKMLIGLQDSVLAARLANYAEHIGLSPVTQLLTTVFKLEKRREMLEKMNLISPS